MSDSHADTIRDYIKFWNHERSQTDALAALDALVAELAEARDIARSWKNQASTNLERWEHAEAALAEARRERDEARQIRDGLYEGGARAAQSIARLTARAEAAEESNARLREALEHIASPNRSARATAQDALDMATFARAVLRASGGSSTDGLPPHDHTIEPGEINRRGCERCQIDEAGATDG